MAKKAMVLFAALVLLAGSARAQDQTARRALDAAAAAMGVTNLKSIQYSGTGWQGAVGQNYTPAHDWPRFDLTSYTRSIDFETQTSKIEMVRRQGNNEQRGGGGTPIQGEQRLTQLVSGNYAWNLEPDGKVTPRPQDAELRQLEIWLTPHGFLKGAMAGQATGVRRWEYDQWVTVVSFTALGKYRINGTINADNVIERIQTWVPNPVAGDMYYETVFSRYREINGVKFPGRWHQHQDYDDGFWRGNASGGDHAFGLETITDVKFNVAGAAPAVPDVVRQGTVPPVRVTSEKLADGVWLLGGGSHNSLLVEFQDSVAVIEAPLNEERSLAVIAEVYKLVPNKPIKYVVNTHHHWDHLGGIRTYRHEGATVVINERNRGFVEEVLTPGPRVLQPDRYSLSPPEEWAEGYTFEAVREKFVLGDQTRTVELYNVQGLAHAVGMLIAYLPKEKIVVQADLYSPDATTPNASNRTFYENIRRLKLDVDRIVGIHGRPGPMSGLAQLMSRSQ
jgi:glyoxylase-like metal-dependent hydrolase (beta-lactamase superfamily II)